MAAHIRPTTIMTTGIPTTTTIPMKMNIKPAVSDAGVLFAWFSPAFPTGGFAYSHGLEAAAAEGLIVDEANMGGWLADVLAYGAGWTDAVLMNLAWQALDAKALGAVAELAAALSASRERLAETTGQGEAFAAAVRQGWPALAPPTLPTPISYPVAAGWSAAALGAPAVTALGAYLTGFTANLIAAGVRLSVCGQIGGVRILAALGPLIAELSARAARAGEADLANCALFSDIASMRHETLPGRLFLS